MNTLIPIINEIVKFGLEPNLAVPNKEQLLERNLVTIYQLYFDIAYTFDETQYADFDKTLLPDIRGNVASNFSDFGLYKKVDEISAIDKVDALLIGDAVDDLCDIITDLLEVRWRIENNSLDDGLWFFELIFRTHTQQHLLDLLNYLKQTKG